jgi:SAM-dependent methyltransferase
MTPARDPRPCLVCGASEWIALPAPGARSMASDWRVLESPLAADACSRCGLVVRPPSAEPELYGSAYALNAHAPGGRFERARYESYGSWIARSVPASPRRVLDVGCGNGSLLLALRTWWPEADLIGCDPSPEGVAEGMKLGLRLWQGAADSLHASLDATVAVAVNVVEHTDDPVSFLASLRKAVSADGTIVVVCPDGERPGIELLIADHRFSCTTNHLRRLFARVGLTSVQVPAPPAHDGFQMIVGTPGTHHDHPPLPDPSPLNARRAAFLNRWGELDSRLAGRLPPRVVCFGVGEAAALLRAYAPAAWRHVTACTADETLDDRFGALPVVPLDTLTRDTAVLVGVRPADQHRVAERLRSQFASVTTWYDLVQDVDGDR